MPMYDDLYLLYPDIEYQKLKWFIDNLRLHQILVEINARRLVQLPQKNFLHKHKIRLIMDVMEHDKDKLQPDMLRGYVEIMWGYKTGNKCNSDLCNQVMIKHITTQKHHPEYWDELIEDKKEYIINSSNHNELPLVTIDAYRMPLPHLAEMVCDWYSTSLQRNTDIYDFINDNLHRRWDFEKEQIEYIEQMVNWLVYQNRLNPIPIEKLISYGGKFDITSR